MNKIILVAILVALVSAGNCGTYETNCGNALMGDGSSKMVAYVTCGMNGFVSHYDIKEEYYAGKNCQGDMTATYKYLYRTKEYSDQTDKNNAKYSTIVESVTVSTDNVEAFTKGMTCTPEMKKGKTYSLKDIRCVYKVGFVEINMFDAYSKIIGTSYDVVIKFENNQANFSNQGGYTFVKSSSFWGCFQGWSLTLLIIVIVLIIVLIVVAVILASKKGKKNIPKKASK